MAPRNSFTPDWVSAPGDTIADVMRARQVTVAELAMHLGLSVEESVGLLKGRLPINISLARKLEVVVGGTAEFWIARDYQYRRDAAAQQAAGAAWLRKLPIGDMIRFGWLSPAPHPTDQLRYCLDFFGVRSVSQWEETYGRIEKVVAFRTPASLESQPAAVAAWIRQGERIAATIDCEPWNPAELRASIPTLRTLTRLREPREFLGKLVTLCSRFGVAVAVVRAPSGCRASGAVRFVGPEKALVLLSFRYLSDDQFWFTFFHEIGHLLLHSKDAVFLEGIDGSTTTEEEEANEFAARALIPAEFVPELLSLPRRYRDIIRFARKVGVSPGIVVGQLQHIGRLRYDQLNRVKCRYTWE